MKAICLITAACLSIPILAQAAEAQMETTSATAQSGTNLTIASTGGGFMASQKIAYFTPFSKKTGTLVSAVRSDNILDALRKQNANRDSKWGVVNLSSDALKQACQEGLVSQMNAGLMFPGNAEGSTSAVSAIKDFFPGTIQSCGIASMAWSSLIVVDRKNFSRRRQPKSLPDFFNIKRFKGYRALPDGPEYTLELALLADGVAANKVYEVLASDDGIKRAFAKLDKIRKRVVWTNSNAGSIKELLSKKVSMALSFNGRVFQTVIHNPGRLNLIWSGQIYDLEFWAIPKRAKNQQQALDFIKFALAPKRLAHQSRLFPYGPTRRSAISMIGKHEQLGVAMAPYVPTARRGFDSALQRNGLWWKTHKAKLVTKFKDWRAGRPLFEVPKEPNDTNEGTESGSESNANSDQSPNGDTNAAATTSEAPASGNQETAASP